MFFQELNLFLFSWRGFLVGQRRGWHAHHRMEIAGHRDGYLLPRSALQEGQLRRAGSLTVEVIARGGHIWGFGFGSSSAGQTSGFTWWRQAVPGVLSNSFFARVRRKPAVKQLRRLILLRPRRRKLFRRGRRLRRISAQVGQLRRAGTLSLSFARRKTIRTALTKVYFGVQLFRGFRTWKKGTRFPDLVFWSRFTRRSQIPRIGKYPHHRRGVHRGGWRMWLPTKIINWLSKRTRWAQLRRTLRVQLHSPATHVTGLPSLFTQTEKNSFSFFSPNKTKGFLKGARQRNPNLRYRPRWINLSQIPLPTVVLLGSTVGATLHREVTRGGIPLLLVGEVDVVPTVGSLYPVWWNSASLEGPRHLWVQFEFLSQRNGLFSLFWNRLACLAEW